MSTVIERHDVATFPYVLNNCCLWFRDRRHSGFSFAAFIGWFLFSCLVECHLVDGLALIFDLSCRRQPDTAYSVQHFEISKWGRKSRSSISRRKSENVWKVGRTRSLKKGPLTVIARASISVFPPGFPIGFPTWICSWAMQDAITESVSLLPVCLPKVFFWGQMV